VAAGHHQGRHGRRSESGAHGVTLLVEVAGLRGVWNSAKRNSARYTRINLGVDTSRLKDQSWAKPFLLF